MLEEMALKNDTKFGLFLEYKNSQYFSIIGIFIFQKYDNFEEFHNLFGHFFKHKSFSILKRALLMKLSYICYSFCFLPAGSGIFSPSANFCGGFNTPCMPKII